MLNEVLNDSIPIFFFFIGTLLALGVSLVVDRMKKPPTVDTSYPQNDDSTYDD